MVLDFFQHAAGVAGGYGVGGNVFGNYRACADGYVIADGYSGKNDGAAADPYVIADFYRLRPFLATIPHNGVDAVASRINADIRADETVVPDTHRSLVQYSEIEVGEESFANADLLAVIAVKRLIDDDPVIGNMAQQAFQN